MEFMKDYNCVIDYHPRKANVVIDALIQKGKQNEQFGGSEAKRTRRVEKDEPTVKLGTWGIFDTPN